MNTYAILYDTMRTWLHGVYDTQEAADRELASLKEAFPHFADSLRIEDAATALRGFVFMGRPLVRREEVINE